MSAKELKVCCESMILDLAGVPKEHPYNLILSVISQFHLITNDYSKTLSEMILQFTEEMTEYLSSRGITQQTEFEKLQSICNLYNVSINLYADDELITILPERGSSDGQLLLQLYQLGDVYDSISRLTQTIQMQKERKIVIIGAGLAGFSAAARLIENGYTNIVILEALNRTGGRVYSIDYESAGKKIDLGAQYIHGEKGNVIWEMVDKHLELGSSPFEEVDAIYMLSNGSLLNQNQCLKLQSLIDKLSEKSWINAKKYNGSFGQFIVDRYKKVVETIAYRGINKEIGNMMLHDAQKQINGYYACSSWFELSGKLNADYDSTNGDQDVTWKTHGFSKVFDFITKKLPDSTKYLNVETKVQLNKEVVNIQYSESPGNKTTLKCTDGSTYEADNVIVTVSLGVLKAHHKTLFTPVLPPRKIKAIKKYGFGTLGKIFLKFDNPFWPVNNTDFFSYSFLWTHTGRFAQILCILKFWATTTTKLIRITYILNLNVA